MRAKIKSLFFLLLCFLGALAASYDKFTMLSVANVAALNAGNFSSYPAVNLRGYYLDNDGGGGVFNQEGTSCTTNTGTIFKDSAGNCFIRQQDGRSVSNKWFGTYGDTTTITSNITVTSGTNAFTITSGTFTSADVGKAISITGAGTSSGTLNTTISAVTSTTTINTTANAGTQLSSSSQTVDYGHDDTTALANWMTYVMNGGSPFTSAYWDGGIFKITSTLTVFSATGSMFNLFTADNVQVHCFSFGNGACIYVNGASGGFSQAIWGPVHINGGTVSYTSGTNANVGLRVQGAGFTTFQGWYFENLGIGFQPYNGDSNTFTEGVVCSTCNFTGTVAKDLEYTVVSGTNSFRSTGFTNRCTINAFSGVGNNGPFIIVDNGALPYFAPLDFTIWPADPSGPFTIIAVNNASPAASFQGQITVEYPSASQVIFGLTSGDTFYYQGNVMLNGGLVAGTNYNMGTMVRIKDLVIDSNGGVVAMPQDQLQVFTVLSTGATISVPAAGSPATIVQVGLSVSASNYIWEGQYVAIINGVTGNVVAVTAVASDLVNNTTGWGAPTVSFSGANVTVTNASWTSGTLVYAQRVYSGQVIPQ